MARPKKEGLDYFPLDVDMDQDDKVALIEAKHGLIGFSVILKLFMKIYKNSYFFEWTEKEQLLFSSRINVDINSLKDVINDCIKWDLFDERVYEEYNILTSKGIQERYMEAVLRRKEVTFTSGHLLIDPRKYVKNSKIKVKIIDDNKNIINVDINPNNENINPQSKSKSESEINKEDEKKPDPVIDLLIRNNIINPTGITATLMDDLNYISSKFGFDNPDEMIIEAIKDSARGNGRTWKFVYGKLDLWRKQGIKNLQDLENQNEYMNKLPKKQTGNVVDFTKIAEAYGNG